MSLSEIRGLSHAVALCLLICPVCLFTWQTSLSSVLHKIPQSSHIKRQLRYGNEWSSWTTWSPCSRSCGGGASVRTRMCLTRNAQEGPCPGEPRQYKICNVQVCPAGSIGFRDLQCAAYNDKSIMGSKKFQWTTFVGGSDPCDLSCLALGQNFYYNFGHVLDGTPCPTETDGVCIKGQCLRPGCDLILGSEKRADACMVCGGHNTSCLRHRSVYQDQNKAAGKIDPVPGEPNISASGNIVLMLAQVIRGAVNHSLYFDNWFSSLDLFVALANKGIPALGTVQKSRLQGCNFSVDTDMKKKGIGTFEEKKVVVVNVEIRAEKWFDNRGVIVASTFASAQPVSNIEKWDRKSKKKVSIECPNIISMYNKFMGGLDALDALIAYYHIHIRSKKYYHRFFFHFVDMALVNSWLSYRRDCDSLDVPRKKQKDLLAFRTSIAHALWMQGNNISRKKRWQQLSYVDRDFEKKKHRGPAKTIPTLEVRSDAVGHWPVVESGRQRCTRPNYRCGKCKKIRGKENRVREYCQKDFVFRGKILEKTYRGQETRYDVQVMYTYRNRFPLIQREFIWVPNLCNCPQLEKGLEYFIMARRHVNYEQTLNRILLETNSYVKSFHPREDQLLRHLDAECVKQKYSNTPL
ncbi:uncharacterized protein adamtsl5 [Polypterus senegalus]|uniref:uncharacterized protein adamtsl5 n=1 Tax=Polypterus senegalus TaxID=55291 RepID=UPI0019651C8E|nr:uncharacterized protein adamtsl5 [Polypterus senegalus]